MLVGSQRQFLVIQEEVQQRTVEQIVDIPVPPATAQERISECIVEQIVGVPVTLSSSKQTVEVVMLVPQERVQQRPVEQAAVTHRQFPTIQHVQKTVELAQAQHIDKAKTDWQDRGCASCVATPNVHHPQGSANH